MKPCPTCGARNVERSVFCNECGQRLPAKPPRTATAEIPGAEPATAPADPLSISVHGAIPGLPSPGTGTAPSTAPVAAIAATPPTPAVVPGTGAACVSCGFRLPPGEVASWCPGCGALFEEPPAAAAAPTPPTIVRQRPPAPNPMDQTRVASSGRTTEPPAAAPVPPGWGLVLLKGGERLDRYALRKPVTFLGRSDADFTFPEDPFLSPRHARIVVREGGFWLEDAGSRNGVYLRLREPGELGDRDMLTFGSLLFRFESFGPGPRTSSLITQADGVKLFGSGRERPFGRLVRILQDGSDGCAYPLTPSRTIVGRRSGHFIFPDDPLLSRQHVQFYERDGAMWVEDLGSSNGTLVRIPTSVRLKAGAVFRIGDVTLEVTAP